MTYKSYLSYMSYSFLKEKIFKRVLQIVFFLALVAPLVVDRRLFFPYVTTGSLYFRFLAGGLFFAWLIFILLHSKYRPRFNWLNISVLVYILAMTAATVFSVNKYLSFWGDAERMFGLFGFLHFFILFLVGQSIFREKKELTFLLNIFVAVSLIVSVYGIFQHFGLTSIKPGEERIVATLGNADLLATYLIFGLFFCLYLGLKNQKISGKWIYGIVAFLHIFAIFLTGSRGAFLGIAAGFLFALFYIVKGIGHKKLKIGIVGGLAFLVLLYGFLYFSQNQNWVKDNRYLYRITHFSLKDATIQQRFMAWQWGFDGFGDKPVLGYGFGNYAVPFNKYFQSKYYNFATEEYFDRAHNIIIELLSTSGLVGLASYLLFLSGIFYFIYRIYKREKDFVHLAVLGGLLVAYFVQNLFIFDALPSMLGLMVLLVFVNNTGADSKAINLAETKDKKLILRPAAILAVSLIFLVAFIYFSNRFILKPYNALKDNVLGQIMLPQYYNDGLSYLKKSVAYNTFLDLDLRVSSANTIFNYYIGGGKNQNEKNDLDLAIDLYKQDLKYLPDDTYYNYKLAELLDFRYAADLDEKFRDEANAYIKKSIASSPQRASVYYILAENLMFAGQFDEAIKVALKTVGLNDQYGASWWQLTKAYYTKQDFIKTKESLIKTIDLGYRISEQNMEMFASLFNVTASPQNEITFLELVVKNGTTDYLYDSTLANLYRQLGNKEEAIFHAERSAQLNPATKDRVDRFIKELKGQ